MPTLNYLVSEEWTDVKDALGLADEVTYCIQNVGASTCHIYESQNKPTIDDFGHQIGSGVTWGVTPLVDNGLWVRAADIGGRAAIVITEA